MIKVCLNGQLNFMPFSSPKDIYTKYYSLSLSPSIAVVKFLPSKNRLDSKMPSEFVQSVFALWESYRHAI